MFYVWGFTTLQTLQSYSKNEFFNSNNSKKLFLDKLWYDHFSSATQNADQENVQKLAIMYFQSRDLFEY